MTSQVEVSSVFSPSSAQFFKRFLDVTVASVLIVLMLPFFVMMAVLISLDGGRVMYAHNRIGRHGRPFKCLKFRTMVPNADQVLKDILERDAAAAQEWKRDFKLRDDPRTTRIGDFLRKSSLDELPQIFNVLKGDMSLVGPRPIVADEVPRYGSKITYYYRVRPGITGLWQISGRNDIDYVERVRLDTLYVRTWSFMNDIMILVKTLPAVLSRDGAY